MRPACVLCFYLIFSIRILIFSILFDCLRVNIILIHFPLLTKPIIPFCESIESFWVWKSRVHEIFPPPLLSLWLLVFFLVLFCLRLAPCWEFALAIDCFFALLISSSSKWRWLLTTPCALRPAPMIPSLRAKWLELILCVWCGIFALFSPWNHLLALCCVVLCFSFNICSLLILLRWRVYRRSPRLALPFSSAIFWPLSVCGNAVLSLTKGLLGSMVWELKKKSKAAVCKGIFQLCDRIESGMGIEYYY